jgi:hypothetical protein
MTFACRSSTGGLGEIHMIPELKNDDSGYAAWFGKSVVLLLAIRHFQIPVPCRIVAESRTDLRVRIVPGCEMDLRKELILAVEEDSSSMEGPPAADYLIN